SPSDFRRRRGNIDRHSTTGTNSSIDGSIINGSPDASTNEKTPRVPGEREFWRLHDQSEFCCVLVSRIVKPTRRTWVSSSRLWVDPNHPNLSNRGSDLRPVLRHVAIGQQACGPPRGLDATRRGPLP